MKASSISRAGLRCLALGSLLLGSAASQAAAPCPQWPRSTEGQRHAQQAQKDSAEASAGYERCKAQGAASIARLACDAEVYRGYLASRERSQAAEQAGLASFRQQPGNCAARAAPVDAARPAIQAPPPAAVTQASSGFVLEPEVVALSQEIASPIPAAVQTALAPVAVAEPVAVAAVAVQAPAAPAELPPMPEPARFKSCRGVPPILEAYSPHGGGFSAQAEVAMAIIDAALLQLEGQCLFLVDYRDMREELGEARTRFEQACNAGSEDGKRCEARRPR